MKFETVRIHSLSDVFGLSSSKNFDTMAIWRNEVSSLFQPLSAFFLEMLDATYTLGACPLLCEVSQKSIRGISRYLVTSLSCNIYSNRPKNNIRIKFSLSIIHVL